MKHSATMVALLLAAVALSFAGESSPKVNKAPFYRPHDQAGKSIVAKPRADSGAVVVNSASFLPGVSPGGLATIVGDVGANLTTVTGTVYADFPLPYQLDGVEVFVGGIPAPIYALAYVGGQDYIDIQVPYAAPTGPGAAEILVKDFGATVADFFTDSFTEDPGIFVYYPDATTNIGYAIAQAVDYSLIGPDNPAIAGEILILYVTGLGPLNDPNLVDGFGAPTSPLAETLDPFQVVVNNEICNVLFSGLTPGLVGLYQINFYVPTDAPPGNVPISIQSTYANSRVATLPVR